MEKRRLHISDLFYFRMVKAALIVFYIGDALYKLGYLITKSYDLPFSPALFPRLIFEVIAWVVILVKLNGKRLFFVEAVVALFVMYVVGVLFYLQNYDSEFKFLFHFGLFNKYIFAFVILHFMYSLRESELIEKLMSLAEKIFCLNSLFVITGVLFKIQFFKSYPFDARFGYNGVITATNEVSLFYFIALSYVYYKKFILHRKIGFSYIIVIASLFLGTKAIYGYLLALLVFHVIRALLLANMTAKILAIMAVSFVSFMFMLWVSSSYSKDLLDYFYHFVDRDGLWSALLSGRDAHVQSSFVYNINEYWGPVNWLFGGQDQRHYLAELDFLDVFSYFGIIGTLFYFYLFFSTLFNFNLKKKFNLFFVLCYFALAALGGHFFYSALNALYLVVFCLFIFYSDRGANSRVTGILGS